MSPEDLARFAEHVKRQIAAAGDERTRLLRLLVLALVEAELAVQAGSLQTT